jgi:hypothetical protein
MRLSTLACVLMPCALLAQSAPSPEELIRRANAAEKAQDQRGWKYTYREDHIQSQIDKNGKVGPPSTDTYEHIMLEGSEYRKLILKDGKPLNANTQKKVDEELQKARAERRRNGFTHHEVSLGTLDMLGLIFDNKVTGEETVLGRKAWRMESEPKPGYKPANKAEEEALASRRVNWFDQEDGIPIKSSDFFIRAVNTFQPGTEMDWELTKVGDDWLTSDTTMRADMKIVLGIHGRVESHQRYYGYKRFTVDSTMTPE